MSNESHVISSMQPPLIPIITVAGAGFALLYAIYRSLLPRPIPGIPYNEDAAKRILGDLPEITAREKAGLRRKTWWADLARKHQSPIAQFFFGPWIKASVVVADYREARDLLLRRGKELALWDLTVDAWQGIAPRHFIAMESHNPRFKGAKALVKDLMTPTFLHEASAPISYAMALNVIRLWEFKAKVAGGAPFDADADLGHMTFDIIAATALGISPSDSLIVKHLVKLEAAGVPRTSGTGIVKFPEWDPSELLDAVLATERAASRALGRPNPRTYHFFNKFSPTARKAFKVKNASMKYYIDRSHQRLLENPIAFEPGSAVDHMVSREVRAATKAGTKPALDSLELRDGLWGYILAGQDSTHSTLCFAVKRLGENQEIQQKLRRALRAAHGGAYRGGRQPTADEITKAQVPYLDAFIQEVLRVNPPAPAISRKAAVDMVILGHLVPKGTLLIFVIDGPTMVDKGLDTPDALRSETSRKHEELGDWADSAYPPEHFQPERWLRPREDGGEPAYDGTAGPFMAFSSGARGCWGKRLAYLELRLVITLLGWNFQFDELPAELHDWEINEQEIFAKPRNTLVRIRSPGDT